MRTLIVDNYDSFTYNLHQYLAEVNGQDPVVIRNDDPHWDVADLRHFDNVVISPGPGRPDNETDFGICRSVIENSDIPLLGVCLGHQGLCQAFGGTVARAPEPVHGQVSAVTHTGVDLLAGLPSPFQAVRYHSLTVTELPPDLEPIAWSEEDGLLMAVRHRTRPLWGVQFHPESIGTEHGLRIMANFATLTRRRTPPPVTVAHRPHPAPAPTDREVLVRRVSTEATPEQVFTALYGTSDTAFWLDSSLSSARAADEATWDNARFSFMGDASGPLARTVEFDVATQAVTVSGPGGVEEHAGSLFDWLDEDLRANRVPAPDLPFDFALGWVGYLGYELKAESGGAPAHRAEQPDAALVFADRALAFDHLDGVVHLLALADPEHRADQLRWLDTTARALAATLPAVAEPSPPPPGAVRLRHDRSAYLKLVDTCQEAIAAGESYEINLTNQVSWQGRLDPLAAYRYLRRHSPAPFAALLRYPAFSVLSSSPERFLRVSRDGVAESRPIKGTRPRGRTDAEDRLLRADLAGSVKDRAENLMIVDLVRNDLGSCAEVGSVRVPSIFQVESYATVHQLVSTVRARLRADVSSVQCVRAAFPGGSMTGAPKLRTMQLIDELEAGPRGVYSGALGYFSLSGAADFSIVIRTLVATEDKATFGVGGAVIALSDPEAEFEETAVKATALLGLLGATFPNG
ncbi:aminodeoxychorismate synthase component I [Solihabitans fulvus]|uniref:aminodeoxychorismate synthase n=1 Tax=Solihabitans fulvus TaxID=1892852 RepID=A0A5B2X640_9PSEU|nr:aminodeoxychorismate synthase component I [Solihabitans fulvus]KAA2258848.1 aminodeoxychorismate synthase component I [Solihabitans fulvus]